MTEKMNMFNKRIKLYFAIIAAFLLFFVILFRNFLPFSFYGNEVRDVIISGRENFRMERVFEREKLMSGMGGRIWMCDHCGMIFDFEHSGRHAFWMKGLKFPLDIVWVSKGKVVWIESNVSHKTPFHTYDPPVESDTVLELKAGSCEKRGIKLGEEVTIK